MKARLPKGYGPKGPANIQEMLKKAQKMQSDMAVIQEELEAKDYPVTVGGGALEVVVTGKKEIKSINIKPEVVNPDDIDMLQDLIISAVNEGMRQVEEDSDERLSEITDGNAMPFGL